MSKNKFDRAPVANSILEIPEVSVPETDPETKANCEGCVRAETYKSVRLRKAPNENAEVITTIPVGEKITLGETVNGWTKVTWSNLFSGWMMDKYIVHYR